MNLTKSIQHIYPAAQSGVHFTTLETADSVPQINAWHYDRPQPSPAQLDAAWERIKDRGNLLTELESAYTNFSTGGKWAFGNAYDTVVNHVLRDDIAAAKLTVQTIVIPAEVPGVPADELEKWKLKRLEILGLFP